MDIKSLVKSTVAEILTLFVDDGKMAIVTLAWLAVVAFLVRVTTPAASWQAISLVAGLAAILVESVWRGSRNRKS